MPPRIQETYIYVNCNQRSIIVVKPATYQQLLELAYNEFGIVPNVRIALVVAFTPRGPVELHVSAYPLLGHGDIVEVMGWNGPNAHMAQQDNQAVRRFGNARHMQNWMGHQEHVRQQEEMARQELARQEAARQEAARQAHIQQVFARLAEQLGLADQEMEMSSQEDEASSQEELNEDEELEEDNYPWD
jgi:hypothetical protein